MEREMSVTRRTLQKSIDFTPLLPSAGPTGGEGEAWPAPTMSLTICSLAGGLRAMVCDLSYVFSFFQRLGLLWSRKYLDAYSRRSTVRRLRFGGVT